MKVAIFGPNLRDQSKGCFVVHAASCCDCAKLRDEIRWDIVVPTKETAAYEVYCDQIDGEEMTVEEALNDLHFAPCLDRLPVV